jgi:tripartite-type tricarboxylate transporter receptor subunit TctC
MLPVIRLGFAFAILTAYPGAFDPAAAQDYPAKPVRIIVPSAAGGSADFGARSIGPVLSEALKQPFVIENRPGAGTVQGSDYVAKSPPDGYTLLLASSAHTTNETLVPDVPFRVLKDFVPVALLNSTAMVMVVSNSMDVKTPKDVVALAKERPGKVTFASSGQGTPYHMAGELFKIQNGIDLVHVPYRLASNARTDVIGGHTQIMFDAVGTMAQNINVKQVKALAVTGKQRSPLLPDVPTFAEVGMPQFDADFWLGVVAPAGTPPAIVAKLNTLIVQAMGRAEVKDSWQKQGVEPMPMTPAEFEGFMRKDIEKWGAVVKAMK